MRLGFAVAGLLFGLALPAAAQTPEEWFAQGNAAYEEGRFADAADAYRKIQTFQIEDARIEFNLGNAEFKMGRKGAAILHFERARQLDPTDREIRENLQYARTFLVDKFETPELPWVIERAIDRQNGLGPDRQGWIALGLIWAICALLAYAFSAPGRWNAGWGWALATLLLILAIVSASWWLTWQRLDGTKRAVVLAPVVEVLAGPGANNAAIDSVHEGLTVEIRDLREEWVQVSLPNGLSGWLPRQALGIV